MSSILPPVVSPQSGPYDEALPVASTEGYAIRKFRSRYDQVFIGPDKREREQEYKIDGDHIRVLELMGPDKLMIATRYKGRLYPFLPVDEGTVIRRRFSSFVVRVASAATEQGTTPNPQRAPICEATFVVSYGDVLSLPNERPVGFRAGWGAGSGVAPLVGIDLFREAFQSATNVWGFSDSKRPAWLRHGGTIFIRNDTAAENLYLYYGLPGAFAYTAGAGLAGSWTDVTSWKLTPGAVLQLRAESLLSTRMHQIRSISIPPSGQEWTTCIAAQAAPGRFYVMASRLMIDGTDPESGLGDPDVEQREE